MKYLPCKSSLSNKKLQLFSMFILKIFIVQFIVHRNLQSIFGQFLKILNFFIDISAKQGNHFQCMLKKMYFGKFLNLLQYEYIHYVFLKYPNDIKYALRLNAYNQMVNACNPFKFNALWVHKVHYRLFNFQQTQLLYILTMFSRSNV